MADAGCRAGFAQKPTSCGLVTEISLADNLQCHRISQIDVEGLVSDSHSTSTQLDRPPICASDQFVVFESLHRVFRFYGSKRPSDAIKASQSARSSSSILAGSETVRPTSSRNNAVYRLRNRWISVLTEPTLTRS